MNINTEMSSSEEPITCNECGQVFDTIESLKEHQEVEKQEKELRSKGIDDWSVSWNKRFVLAYVKHKLFEIEQDEALPFFKIKSGLERDGGGNGKAKVVSMAKAKQQRQQQQKW